MNIFKLFTQNGRRSIARDALKEALTPKAVSEWVADAVNKGLLVTLKDVDDAKLKRIVGYCSDGADLFKAVALAVADRTVTAEEAAYVYEAVARLSGNVIDQARIDSVIETLVSKVP